MGASVPKPTCQVTNPRDVDTGTTGPMCMFSPAPVCGLTNPVSLVKSPMTVDTLVFDERTVHSFLRSVAHAKTMERHVKMKTVEYKDSTVLNVIYTVLWWKGAPVTFEVDYGDQKVLESDTNAETEKLLSFFLDHAQKGPESVSHFLENQEETRRRCLETVDEVIRDVEELTEAVIGAARDGIKRLAIIKAGATITFKTLGTFATGPGAFFLDMGYDMTLSAIKDWNKSGSAKLIGMAGEGTKDTVEEGIKQGAEHMEKIYEKEAAGPERQAEWLRKRVAAMEEDLTKNTRSDLMRKLGKDSRRLARAESAAKRASRGARIMSTVKFLFLAKDIYEAVDEARETMDEAGE